jgi:hypothetical protein
MFNLFIAAIFWVMSGVFAKVSFLLGSLGGWWVVFIPATGAVAVIALIAGFIALNDK